MYLTERSRYETIPPNLVVSHVRPQTLGHMPQTNSSNRRTSFHWCAREPQLLQRWRGVNFTFSNCIRTLPLAYAEPGSESAVPQDLRTGVIDLENSASTEYPCPTPMSEESYSVPGRVLCRWLTG